MAFQLEKTRLFMSSASFSLFLVSCSSLIGLKGHQVFKQKGLDPYWNHSILELSVLISTLEILVLGMIHLLTLWTQCKHPRNYIIPTLLLFLFNGEKDRESQKLSHSKVILINGKDMVLTHVYLSPTPLFHTIS